MLTLIVPRTPSLMMKSQERERRVETPNDISITRRVKEATVSARLIIVWILWLTPTRRIMDNVVKESHLLGLGGQLSILSSC